MAQATTFYLPFFETGFPFGKLFTYISGTNTLAPTYKEDGSLNTNPIILDEKGRCVLYIDRDITYRYVLQNQFGDTIGEYDNIKQLNGDPGPPGGPKGATGDRGRMGNQGISGGQGPNGLDGVKGDKGPSYLVKIVSLNNQEYTIPKGTEAIYITGTAAGGAGASWSPYVFMFDNIDPNITNKITDNPQVKRTVSGAIVFADNKIIHDTYSFNGLIFTPGSGFSGQSVYRYKIELNKEQSNVVQCFLGTGGQPLLNSTLDGSDGTNTLIYVNGVLKLELAGGKGGKNIFPKDSTSIPILPEDGTPVRLNRGFKKGLLYFKSSNTNMNDIKPPSAQANFVWPTTYKQRNGTTFVNSQVQLSYISNVFTIDAFRSLNLQFNTKSMKNLVGESNIMMSKYSIYQDKREIPGTPNFSTALKTTNGDNGWGAGGDCYYAFNGAQSYQQFFSSFYTNEITFVASGPFSMSFFRKQKLKDKIKKYMVDFTLTDSFSPGVADIPADDDPVWSFLDNAETLANNPSSYQVFSGTGFYKNDALMKINMSRANTIGEKGQDGYCIIEYGLIVEHKE